MLYPCLLILGVITQVTCRGAIFPPSFCIPQYWRSAECEMNAENEHHVACGDSYTHVQLIYISETWNTQMLFLHFAYPIQQNMEITFLTVNICHLGYRIRVNSKFYSTVLKPSVNWIRITVLYISSASHHITHCSQLFNSHISSGQLNIPAV